MKNVKSHQNGNPLSCTKRGNKLVKKSCKENRKIESCSKICSTNTSSPLGDHRRNLCAAPHPLCGQPEGAERRSDASCALRAALLCSHFLRPRAAAPPLPRLTMPGSPFPGWVPQVLGLPVLQGNMPGLFLQRLCSGVFSSCLNKCHWGLKNALVSQYKKTGQIEVILAHPAHLCLRNLVPLKGSGSLICSLSHWSSK